MVGHKKYKTEGVSDIFVTDSIVAQALDVPSDGSGAQSTVMLSYVTPELGLFRIDLQASSVAGDTVTATAAWTDPIAGAQLVTMFNATVIPPNGGTGQTTRILRASAGSTITVRLTVSSSATTQFSMVIERLA